jgi:hypothetical protein
MVDHETQKRWDDEVEAARGRLNPYQRARLYLQLRNDDGLSESLARELIYKHAPRKAA